MKAGTQKPRHQATRNPPPFVVPAKAGTQKVPRLQPSLSLSKRPLSLLTPLPSLLERPTASPTTSTTSHRQHFEHTVLDLLENMGYGHARHVGHTGDGDIDGIIDQDTLGLDRLYVQAKRWTDPVGEPEIRNFSGSLDAYGATRGILVTTSDFTDTARKTAKTISIGTKHIRLVNGHELAHLILKHSIRVTPDTPQHSRKQDKNHHTHHT